MKASSLGVLAAMLCVVVCSCGGDSHRPDGTGGNSTVFYFNSFESASDTTGWKDIDDDMFVVEPAPDCGERSLLVSGGCIQPTAYIVLRPRASDAEYTISCWGKLRDESRSGGVVLTRTEGEGASQQVGFPIECVEWRRYRSQETLYCPAGEELRLEVWIGGLIGASMLLDCVEVRKVD